MRESSLMKIHYITGFAAIVLVAIHIMSRLVMPYDQSLEYENVIQNYKNLPYVLVLELILITVTVHGFNGLRIILIELKQGKVWEKSVTWFCIIAAISLMAYGSRTILLAYLGEV